VATYPWLDRLFIDPAAGNLHPRTVPAGVISYRSQLRWFRKHYPELEVLVVQRGNRAWVHERPESLGHGADRGSAGRRDDGVCDPALFVAAAAVPAAAPAGCNAYPDPRTDRHGPDGQRPPSTDAPILRLPWRAHGSLELGLRAMGRSYGVVAETGWLRGGMRRRVLVAFHLPQGAVPHDVGSRVSGDEACEFCECRASLLDSRVRGNDGTGDVCGNDGAESSPRSSPTTSSQPPLQPSSRRTNVTPDHDPGPGSRGVGTAADSSVSGLNHPLAGTVQPDSCPESSDAGTTSRSFAVTGPNQSPAAPIAAAAAPTAAPTQDTPTDSKTDKENDA
jgi:hypothetical protein